MNYLTVKPEGELHVFEGPEEPGYCTITGCTPTEVCGCRNRKQQHEQAMLTASQSSVRCKDQQQAWLLANSVNKTGPFHHAKLKPGAFYPLPEEVRVSYEWINPCIPEKRCLNAEIETCKLNCKKLYCVAILTVGAVEDKQEEIDKALEWVKNQHNGELVYKIDPGYYGKLMAEYARYRMENP